MSCRFPDHYLLDPNASKCMDVTNGPLSVASVKAKGKKWEIFTPKVHSDASSADSMLDILLHLDCGGEHAQHWLPSLCLRY